MLQPRKAAYTEPKSGVFRISSTTRSLNQIQAISWSYSMW